MDTILLIAGNNVIPKDCTFFSKNNEMIHFKLTKAKRSSEFSDHLLSVVRLSVYQSVSKLFSFSSSWDQTWHMVQTQTHTKIFLTLLLGLCI